MKAALQDIVKESIDLHVHVGPEIIPRKYTAQTLSQQESGKLKGCVLKNHFYPSLGAMDGGLMLYGSIVLNAFVGGLNPDAIYAAALVSPAPLFVWFPTLHTEQFLKNTPWEIPQEWVGKPDFRPRPSCDVKPIVISDGGKLNENVFPVLRAIAETKSVLCTGHISWQESCLVVQAAKERGIDKVILTHPIYQKIDMPIAVQIELASMGCLIEHCFSMYSIDKVPMQKIAQQIRQVGVERVVLSSDVGQTFSPSPSEALFLFASLLQEEGFSLEELRAMLCQNPQKVL